MVESNRDDYDIILVKQYNAIVTSGKYKDKIINQGTLNRLFPGIKTGSNLVISNKLLDEIMGE